MCGAGTQHPQDTGTHRTLALRQGRGCYFQTSSDPQGLNWPSQLEHIFWFSFTQKVLSDSCALTPCIREQVRTIGSHTSKACWCPKSSLTHKVPMHLRMRTGN